MTHEDQRLGYPRLDAFGGDLSKYGNDNSVQYFEHIEFSIA